MTSAAITFAMIANILSRLWNSSSDTLYWRLQAVSSCLVGLTFLVGFWTVRVGVRANRRQAREIAGLSRGTEELHKANIEAQRELDKERQERRELEQTLIPRHLTIESSGSKSNIDALKEFAGTKFVLRYLPKEEPQEAASHVAGLLKAAGWQMLSANSDPSINTGELHGVIVETPSSISGGADVFFAQQKFKKRAEVLVEFLISSGWDATIRPGPDVKPDDESELVIVTVGKRPLIHFLSPVMKEVHQRLEEVQKEMAESRKQQEEEDKQRAAEDRRIDELIKRGEFATPPPP
jgi:hypothetical protein